MRPLALASLSLRQCASAWARRTRSPGSAPLENRLAHSLTRPPTRFLARFFALAVVFARVGWASLYTLFLDAGVYSDLCEQPGEICAEQKERLTFIYTGASATQR